MTFEVTKSFSSFQIGAYDGRSFKTVHAVSQLFPGKHLWGTELKKYLTHIEVNSLASPVMTVSPAGLPTSEQPHCVKDRTEAVGSKLSHSKEHIYLSLRSEWVLPVSNIEDKRSSEAFRKTTSDSLH